MRVTDTFYRGHDPKWSWLPTSGEGSAIRGGRWNAQGVPALYLSSSPDGVYKEMTQGFPNRMKPMMIVQYNVDCDDIVDLTSKDVRSGLGIELSDMSGEWMPIEEGDIPVTWDISDALIGGGYVGILVPSFAPEATPEDINLVLWDWSDDLPHQVLVYDPDDQLPKDASSWEPRPEE